jgi:tetratricopeptide (TPR) repeat protein
MGAELLKKIIPAVEKMDWPSQPQIHEPGKRAYEIALDQVDSFKSDARVLAKALEILQGCESKPLGLAGVAYTLIAASAEKDDSYASTGLRQAMMWLEDAQAVAPDEIEINFIEALVYIYGDQMDNARLVLDYLLEQDVHRYYRLLVAEATYWHRLGDLEQMAHWYDLAGNEAVNVPQRLRLVGRMADAYLAAGDYEKAEVEFKKAIHFDGNNPVLWHRLSLIYWRQEKWEEAQRWNAQVIKAGAKIPAAVKMSEALKEKLDQGGFMNKLFGR